MFVVDSDDPTVGQYPKGHVYVTPPAGFYVAAIRRASKDPALVGEATIVGFLGDDNRFRTKGWDRAFQRALTERPGIAYGDDGLQHERLPTSWWVSRKIVDVFGLAEAGFHHFYVDNIWKDLGKAADCLTYLPDVYIEHMHPLLGKAPNDATYDRGARNANHDRRMYAQWQRATKARQIRQLKEILGKVEPRRVLADWHHPSLWESLRILFEDRFGWELYSPLGMDWTQHGWTFQMPSIGWSAKDYLEHPKAKLKGDHYELVEREYPERPRKLVTWDQAQRGTWDFVVASVATHQRPFAALAREFGARFVHQVGNAMHPIDKAVPQITLASALVPRATVVYHQEFSRSLFAPTPPKAHAGSPRVSSFMLRLDATSGPYDWLRRNVNWSDVGGHDPRNGHYVYPMARVAEQMIAADWIWHDKIMGDGYGHVIHNAASIGRPLIGHSSHYKGRLGEPLWRDLETCVDLDKHPTDRALRLVKAISADPAWLSEMSKEMIATFERVVDFDAEAQQIREVLG